jgi:hypothetical protein
MSTSTTSTFHSFDEAVKNYTDKLIESYSEDPDTHEPLDLAEDRVKEITQTADFAATILVEQMGPYFKNLETQIATLEAQRAQLVQQLQTTTVPGTTAQLQVQAPTVNNLPAMGQIPYNPKAHNPYQTFVKMQLISPLPEVAAQDKSTGQWSHLVGELWKKLYPTDDAKQGYFMQYRAVAFPNVNFETKTSSKQHRSGYNFYQMLNKGNGRNSSDIADAWKAMTPAEKQPYDDMAAREKRGEIINIVPVPQLVTAPIPATVTPAQPQLQPQMVHPQVVAPQVVAPQSVVVAPQVKTQTGYTLFQQEKTALGMSTKDIVAAWRALSAVEKQAYNDKAKVDK